VSAHGLTFFISPTKNMSTPFSNQFLGLLSKKANGNSSNHVFAVELDTVLSSYLLDDDDKHVGIDIEGPEMATRGGEWKPQISFKTLVLGSTHNPKTLTHTKVVRYTC
jgi:hypothetical protein